MRDFSQTRVTVIGDFRTDDSEIQTLIALGGRVSPVGLATAAQKSEWKQLGLEVSGIVRSRKAVAEAAVAGIAGADAVLFAGWDWDEVYQAVIDAEIESALSDGRFTIPIVSPANERYATLVFPDQRAAFTLARGAGASFEEAEKFSRRERGHQKQNITRRAGDRNVRKTAAGRRTR